MRQAFVASFAAASALACIASFQIGATSSGHPVRRIQVIRNLDPENPDFVLPDDFAFEEPAGWRDLGFDDSAWTPAVVFDPGYYGATIGVPEAKGIWTGDTNGDDRVAFRHTFSSPAAAGGTLLIVVDNDFRAFLNGVPVAENLDGEPWSVGRVPHSFDIAVAEGMNVIAIEGIDAGGAGGLTCGVRGPHGLAVSDGSWRTFVIEAHASAYAGSAWARIEIPDLDRRYRPTWDLQRIGTRSALARQLPELRHALSLSGGIPTLIDDGSILVQLTDRSGSVLVPKGAYRLVVDLAGE